MKTYDNGIVSNSSISNFCIFIKNKSEKLYCLNKWLSNNKEEIIKKIPYGNTDSFLCKQFDELIESNIVIPTERFCCINIRTYYETDIPYNIITIENLMSCNDIQIYDPDNLEILVFEKEDM